MYPFQGYNRPHKYIAAQGELTYNIFQVQFTDVLHWAINIL